MHERKIVDGEENIPLDEAWRHGVESAVSKLSSMAHAHIDNGETKELLFSKLEEMVRMEACL